MNDYLNGIATAYRVLVATYKCSAILMYDDEADRTENHSRWWKGWNYCVDNGYFVECRLAIIQWGWVADYMNRK